MKYLSFKEFVEKYGLKNEATSNVKIKEILNELNIPCGIYMRDDKFTTDSGIVNLHPSVGTHWVMYTNKNSFDSYGCPPPLNIMSFIKSAKLRGIYSEHKIQKDYSYKNIKLSRTASQNSFTIKIMQKYSKGEATTT